MYQIDFSLAHHITTFTNHMQSAPMVKVFLTVVAITLVCTLYTLARSNTSKE